MAGGRREDDLLAAAQAARNQVDSAGRVLVRRFKVAFGGRNAPRDEIVHDACVHVLPEHVEEIRSSRPEAECGVFGGARHIGALRPAGLHVLVVPVREKRRHVESAAEKDGRQHAVHFVACFVWKPHFRKDALVVHHVGKAYRGVPEGPVAMVVVVVV